jgi:hypothetical protein
LDELSRKERQLMSFFRRSKSNRPKPESYQERLRAIGRKLDDDGLRFAALVELPDGMLLKAEQLALRGSGESSAWDSHTIWFTDEDVSAMINTGYEQRGEKRDKR